MEWDEFERRVKALASGKYRKPVAIAYHPAPRSDIIAADWNILVRIGAEYCADTDGNRIEI
ncbi:MAG: hypothetical protein RLZZ182_1921 [Pseudomonadota bacterium]|jgi:hypothetical protein